MNATPQLFPDNPLSGSGVDDAVKEDQRQFYNPRDPNFGIMSEKPEHRIVILLKAQCKSNGEISRLTGYTQSWVSQILRQPWARERLLAEINANGGDAVGDILAGAVIDSLSTIIDLRDKADDDAIRLRAAQDLVDRHLGKATTKIESNNTTRHLNADMEAVNKELVEVERQLGIGIGGLQRN
jgi:hypothetical protein